MADFGSVFSKLKTILVKHSKSMTVKVDADTEYTLYSKSPSPFPQHKGQPMYFGSVRLGKAYVSFHLMPLYMNPALTGTISATLKKRMQGKTCFNFKADPGSEIIAELAALTGSGFQLWKEKGWL
jgi:hypothetical protein